MQTDFREIVKKALEAKRMTRSELCRKADCTQAQLARWLNDPGRKIRSDLLERLFAALGIRTTTREVKQ